MKGLVLNNCPVNTSQAYQENLIVINDYPGLGYMYNLLCLDDTYAESRMMISEAAIPFFSGVVIVAGVSMLSSMTCRQLITPLLSSAVSASKVSCPSMKRSIALLCIPVDGHLDV